MPGERKQHARRAAARPQGAAGRPHRLWIWGLHAARAALANPRRRVLRTLATEEVAGTLTPVPPGLEIAPRQAIAAVLPPGAVHQGLAVLCKPLDPSDLDALCRAAAARPRAVLVVLDRVSDPHNVGAVLRSAGAFGAAAVVVPARHAPEESGALAKAASGALERVPLVAVPNLARALETLKAAGFWCFALEAGAPARLEAAALPPHCAFVLGAEGAGLRRLTAERCDARLRIPMPAEAGSLNVSVAAAIALYAFAAAEGGD